MIIDGSILIGARDVRRDTWFTAFDPLTGSALDTQFCEASTTDVAEACTLAAASFESFSGLMPEERAGFLEAVADAITEIGDILVETAMAETGLPRGRIENERGRTTGQLRMFAAELRRGEWVDVTIDTALPDRAPPRSDLRRMNIALGPVAVFGASNFPLAFSVAGGDTASAFAAGCPVVVKGHPAHPATGELVARAIRNAVAACNLHEGVFSFLPGTTNKLGAALVSDPSIKAVGFTGSRSGGLALAEIASRRPEPIPVYAEMSSVNPVILLPAALTSRAQSLGAAFAASLTLGSGQFCTNPGLIIAVGGSGLDAFIDSAAIALAACEPSVMLTPLIQNNYARGVAALDANAGAQRVSAERASDVTLRCRAALFRTDASTFLGDASLAHEVFGASAVIVSCASTDQMMELLRALEGQLTATIHMDGADLEETMPILQILQSKAGRVLANGWPTGVEVSNAMVHGGPFPATSDGRTTSVGALAIMRYLRPVCFQDIPESLLPPPLRQENAWQLPRTINGKREV